MNGRRMGAIAMSMAFFIGIAGCASEEVRETVTETSAEQKVDEPAPAPSLEGVGKLPEREVRMLRSVGAGGPPRENLIKSALIAKLAQQDVHVGPRSGADCRRRGPAAVKDGTFDEVCAVEWGRANGVRWVIQLHPGRNQGLHVWLVDSKEGLVAKMKEARSTTEDIAEIAGEFAELINKAKEEEK